MKDRFISIAKLISERFRAWRPSNRFSTFVNRYVSVPAQLAAISILIVAGLVVSVVFIGLATAWGFFYAIGSIWGLLWWMWQAPGVEE